MTKNLEKAFEHLESLPNKDQNAIAELIMQELKWKKSFSENQHELANLAQEALVEYKKGKTKKFDL